MNKYLLGSGYVHRPNSFAAERMFALWLANIHKYANPKPSRIVVICVGGAMPDVITADVDVVMLKNNLGHGHHLLGIEQTAKPHAYSGWSGAFLSTAMLAYCNESDFLWQESDCLGFGDYVGQMYRELGDYEIGFGGQMRSAPWMPSHQSLVLIKHAVIPEIVRAYLSCGDERDPQRMVEHKFANISRFYKPMFWSDMFRDRMRPLPYAAPVWSAQQFTAAELDELRLRKLI